MLCISNAYTRTPEVYHSRISHLIATAKERSGNEIGTSYVPISLPLPLSYVRSTYATESGRRKQDNKGKKITKEIPNLPKVTAELRIYSNASNGRGLSRNQSARAK